jgi:hypothetical protein
MFRPIWASSGTSKLILESVAVPSMNTIPNFTFFNAPILLTSVTCNSNCVSISRMEYIGVSYNAVGWILVVLGSSSTGLYPLLCLFMELVLPYVL